MTQTFANSPSRLPIRRSAASLLLPRIALPLAFLGCLGGVGCHAQVPPADQAKSQGQSQAQTAPVSKPELDRRIEILVRNKFQVPADVTIQLGQQKPSAFAGFNTLPVSFVQHGNVTPPVDFLLSTDGKTLARMQTYDLSKDPKDVVTGLNRPSRGPANAPVQIVVFDDLECPYCARMHQQLFPATLDHYKNLIHIAYKDYPLVEIHPWAMRAAVDSNCLFAQSNIGYWNLVDYVHAHAGELGGEAHSPEKAGAAVDQLTLDEGQRQKVDVAVLKACIAKQDDAQIRASMHQGDALGVNATPILFVNGERIDGAVPMADVWKVIDRALVAAGVTPPPEPAATPAPGTPSSGTPGSGASAPAKPSGQ